MKKNVMPTLLRVVGLILALAVFLYSGYRIAAYFLEGQESRKVTLKLIEQAVTVTEPEESANSNGSRPVQTLRPTPGPDGEEAAETGEATGETETVTEEKITVDFDALQSVNPDIVGWMYLGDTPIHYPVLQAEDNSTYLYRLVDGSSNTRGSLFMDFRNASDFSDWNTLIYGHNMKDGSMFGELKKYKKQSFYDAHPVIQILTPDGGYDLEVFAAVTTTVEAVVYRGVPADREARDEIVKWAQENSAVQCNVEIGSEDRLATLSTCTGGDNDRFVVLGVLRQRGEEA